MGGTLPAGDALLLALQLGDGGFPSGAFSASWGLEGLHADGAVHDRATLAAFVEGHLRHRWAGADRWGVTHAHRAGDDLAAVAEVDRALEACTPVAAARAASARTGAALLRVHAALDWPVARAYAALVDAGDAPGHGAAVLGLVGRARGLDEPTTVLLSGYQVASGLTAAAVRLGIVGHLDAQRVLDTARPLVAALAAGPLPEAPWSFTPAADVAMMAHETRDARLFSC
jgi:urease accessory protein